MAYTSAFTMFDSTSDNSSTFTSNAFLIQDFDKMSASVDTQDTGASRWTFQVCNEDGRGASLTTWFTYVTVTARGVTSALTAGPRWLRCLRSSLDSTGIVYLTGRQTR